MGDGFKGIVTTTSVNKANITYKVTDDKYVFFNRSQDFEMTDYHYFEGNINLTENQGVVLIASNPFNNGTPTYFEIQY